MKNPPAFDNILIEQYETLERVVEPKWLPTPIVVGTAAHKEIQRQHERIRRAQEFSRSSGVLQAVPDVYNITKSDAEKIIARLSGKKKKRQGFKEYGSGHYGTIYPTQTEGVVCKITTDASEAKFIANAISLKKWPDGITKYYAVFRFKDKRYKKRPVFILWRDEVHPPQLGMSDESTLITLTHNVKDIAHQARRVLIRGNKNIPEEYPENMQIDVDAFNKATGALRWINSFPRAPRAYRLAAYMDALRMGCRDIMSWSYAFKPGEAMWFYIEHGMLLADVHANNIMKGPEGWIISDPGHMVELDNRYSNVQVPEI